MAQGKTMKKPSADTRRKRKPHAVLKEELIILSRWQILILLALTFSVAASGLALVDSAQQMRSLHSGLDTLQSKQDRLMAQYSRLLLERSAFAGLQTVEIVASEELNMRFPRKIEAIVE